ncbi:MAG: 3-phosphoshikimate 1-carboxyvinyltransferase [Candidatus Lokiarchaeota archaeon]|nr:3-phosphoshikimate 1-carboxyvinyltransferase [Candidatus Lokiarchaeota archaeon]MBD3341310.1 3-phosphoshikimate 1-carboxyvinyltransferase [Candidatus Lokiarchaeota archaeon]
MKFMEINPIKQLSGELIAPSSKSYSHRAFIAASLTDGISVLKNPLDTGDVRVTINILIQLGVKVLQESKNSYIVERTERAFNRTKKRLDCKNSGTTLRILSALALLIEGGLALTGEFLRRNRPITPLLEALKALGGKYKVKKRYIRIYRRKKKCDIVKIPGNISSQFITALLFLGSKLNCPEGDILRIQSITPLISYPYVQITLDVLKSFGVYIQEKILPNKTRTYLISPDQKFRPIVYEIPGDFSSSAFIIAAGVLSPQDSKIIINNLDIKNPQGDKRIIKILKDMGAKIEVIEDKKQVIIYGNIKEHPLKGIEIDCSNIPDLFPILAVIGVYAQGKTILFNAAHLRHKESDRISVIARELSKMGGNLKEEKDKLVINHSSLKGTTINHDNDHRIAMACIIAALYSSSSSKIKNLDIIKDSYPSFLEDLQSLGANFSSKT